MLGRKSHHRLEDYSLPLITPGFVTLALPKLSARASKKIIYPALHPSFVLSHLDIPWAASFVCQLHSKLQSRYGESK